MSKRSLAQAVYCYLIQGGRPLTGRVQTEGAKNAVLPLLAATLLSDDPIRLGNVPAVEDVATMCALLTRFGKTISTQADVFEIQESGCLQPLAPDDLVRRMRASFIVLGPLLARLGQAQVPLPGGCVLGPRPVDFHLNGLRALGATITLREGVVYAEAQRLHGANLYLDFPSVGATQHLLMTAALIPEKTVIHNAAHEPEVYELIHLLVQMGVRIQTAPNHIEVVGQPRLKEATYQVIPDRLNAGTYLIAGAITGGDITVECIPSHLDALLIKLQEAGMSVSANDTEVHLNARHLLRSSQLSTGTYPGFANDLQPQMIALLTLAQGDSLVRETVFKDRFGQVPELQRMGADIQVKGDTAFIRGVPRLEGTEVHATDIRSGAALVLAGLAACGQTRVVDAGHTTRGYVDLAGKLRQLGGRIEMESL